MIEYEKTSALTVYFMDAQESRVEYPAEKAKTASLQLPPPKIITEKINWVQGELLGSGACGNVYLGLNIDTGQLMAVKQVEHADKGARGVSYPGSPPLAALNSTSYFCLSQRVTSLMKEMEFLSHLHHQNIVGYMGIEHDGTYTNVFLEYVPGGSIHGLLAKFGSFDEKLIRVYMRQILSGLKYLHGNGLVHRDIKGANILLDTTGRLKLADFGMASKILAGTNRGTTGLAGTSYWMAPEVVRQQSFGKPADIWSVGCVMVEMATGKPPWNQFSQEVAAMFHIASTTEPPVAPAWLSPEAHEFLTLCFNRDAAQRPSVEDLLQHAFITKADPGGEHHAPNMVSKKAEATSPTSPSSEVTSASPSIETTTYSPLHISPPQMSAGAGVGPSTPRTRESPSRTSSDSVVSASDPFSDMSPIRRKRALSASSNMALTASTLSLLAEFGVYAPGQQQLPLPLVPLDTEGAKESPPPSALPAQASSASAPADPPTPDAAYSRKPKKTRDISSSSPLQEKGPKIKVKGKSSTLPARKIKDKDLKAALGGEENKSGGEVSRGRVDHWLHATTPSSPSSPSFVPDMSMLPLFAPNMEKSPSLTSLMTASSSDSSSKSLYIRPGARKKKRRSIDPEIE